MRYGAWHARLQGLDIIVMVVSFLLALVLTVLPFWARTQVVSPAWGVMAICYWMLQFPSIVGFIAAWCLGLLLDVVLLSSLGVHALAMLLIAYMAKFDPASNQRKYKRREES